LASLGIDEIVTAPASRTAGSRNYPQRATSQTTAILVPGLLSSVAKAPLFRPRRAGRSSGTFSRIGPNCRVSCRSGTPSLLSP
jgi:hypothetical protein